MEKEKKDNILAKFELAFSVLFKELSHSNNGLNSFFGAVGFGASTLVFFLSFLLLILSIVFIVLLITSYKHRNDNDKTYNITSIIFITISFIYIGTLFSFYLGISKFVGIFTIMILAQIITYIPLFITKLMTIIQKN